MNIIIALAITIALVALCAQGVQAGNDVDGLVAKQAKKVLVNSAQGDAFKNYFVEQDEAERSPLKRQENRPRQGRAV